MEKERKTRYEQKIEVISEKLDDSEEFLPEFQNKINRYACYKAFQEGVEGIFDIIAMLVKDNKKIVEDDYSNINKIKELNIITEQESAILKEANGLRNRIIHRYNAMDDNIAEESITDLLPKLKQLLDRISENIK